MKIHEYQAKAILERYGVPVPRGEVASNATEAGEIARRLGGSVVVVKAQIHAGGRGKGGGVKLAKSPQDAEKLARAMIGMTLITHQTGPDGRVVGRVLVEEGLQMQRELYLSLIKGVLTRSIFDEVATTMRVSRSAAKSRIYRAAKRLRADLTIEEVF